jgi:uncharacterized protein (DUF302 family)
MRTPIVKYLWAALVALGLCISSAPYSSAANPPSPVLGDGLVRVKSAYSFAETIMRIKEDVAAKGIVFFQEIDQAKLASDAKITLNPSTLLVFGNPALGTQFLTSNPYAGIDWPVRLLVTENAKGEVWMVYTDFAFIAHRHRIRDRDAAFKMASDVISSITRSAVSK